MCAFEQELVKLPFCIQFSFRYRRERESEREISSFIIIFVLRSSIQWEAKIVYNISFLPNTLETRHTNGTRPKYFGKIYFSSFLFCFYTFHRLLHISHFSPFRIFGSCYFCDDCRAAHCMVCATKIFARVGCDQHYDWQESPPPSSSPMLPGYSYLFGTHFG